RGASPRGQFPSWRGQGWVGRCSVHGESVCAALKLQTHSGKRSSRRMKRFQLLQWVLLAVSPVACAGTLAQFRTVFGDIEVELYDQDKPITVQNFVRYVQSGRYRNSILHRCPVNPISGLSDFVVQGGGIWVTNRGATNAALQLISSFSDIPNEFSVGRQFSNVY